MKKLFSKGNIHINSFLLILLSICFSQANSQTFHDINDDVSGYSGYKKAEFSQDSSFFYYFKHRVTFVSKSQVTAFRFEFDQFDAILKNSKIFCTTVETSTSDTDLKTILDGLDESTSSCVGDFSEDENKGIYDGIIKLSTSKMMIGIILKLEVVINFNGRIYLRTEEEDLTVKEQEKSVD